MAEDRDAAAYLMNDFYNLLDEKQVYFFPSSYKRSVAYGAEDAQGVVQRTAAMNAVKGFTKGYLIVCTYPEAGRRRRNPPAGYDRRESRRQYLDRRAGGRARRCELHPRRFRL